MPFQEKGYECVIDGIPRIFYGTLTLVSGDNLASSSLGGFKEGGSAHRHCRHCHGTAEETRQMVSSFKHFHKSFLSTSIVTVIIMYALLV